MAKKAATKTASKARSTKAARGGSDGEGDGDLSGWQQRALDRSLTEAKRRALTKSNGFVSAAMELLEETGGFAFDYPARRFGSVVAWAEACASGSEDEIHV